MKRMPGTLPICEFFNVPEFVYNNKYVNNEIFYDGILFQSVVFTIKAKKTLFLKFILKIYAKKKLIA